MGGGWCVEGTVFFENVPKGMEPLALLGMLIGENLFASEPIIGNKKMAKCTKNWGVFGVLLRLISA